MKAWDDVPKSPPSGMQSTIPASDHMASDLKLKLQTPKPDAERPANVLALSLAALPQPAMRNHQSGWRVRIQTRAAALQRMQQPDL